MKIKMIGIDLDTHDEWVINQSRKRLRTMGMIKTDEKSRHGWHFKIILFEPMTFEDSVIFRMWCFDDPYRILYDIIRTMKGYRHIDLIFSKKWRGWK